MLQRLRNLPNLPPLAWVGIGLLAIVSVPVAVAVGTAVAKRRRETANEDALAHAYRRWPKPETE